jgi:hypothetical protein
MTSLFELGGANLPAWYLKQRAVLAGITEAEVDVEQAENADERRLAEQKLTRFQFTLGRLIEQRMHTQALAAALMDGGEA